MMPGFLSNAFAPCVSTEAVSVDENAQTVHTPFQTCTPSPKSTATTPTVYPHVSSFPMGPRISQKQKRKAAFTIYCDPPSITDKQSKHSKASSGGKTRPALKERVGSANTSPAPSPRALNEPFPFSSDDPLWENLENYEPTPPETTWTAPPDMYDTVPPAAGSSRRPRNRAALRPRRNLATNILPRPVNMALYDLLKITDWKATKAEIRSAYRKVAFRNHPDKVRREEERQDATVKMQQINMAKELLLDNQKRRKYHMDGLMPQAMA